MSTAGRRADFFALEAVEYLTELAQLVAQPDQPDAERLVRGARALRGAALMAGLGTFARAAASLEGVARAVRDHSIDWDAHGRPGCNEGLIALRELVAGAATWGADDDRRALGLAERLDRMAGGIAPAAQTITSQTTLTPGVRAFIARESALIAGSLEQAARALAPVPPPAALAAVLERMRALRGLGPSADLSPLPELLDAMEVATRTLLADHPAPPDVAAVFADAGHALSLMARNIAESGRAIEPVSLGVVARRLLESYATERDVVPIETLAPTGADSIARLGAPPDLEAEGDPVPVEMVSVGDHLLLTADVLSRGTSPAARDLRLFVLHRTLSTMPPRSGTARFLTPLAAAIRKAIAQSLPVTQPDTFVGLLRACGRFLVDASGHTDPAMLARQRDTVVAGLTSDGPPLTIRPDNDDSEIVDVAALAPDDDDIVGIATLAPDDDVVDIGALAPDGDSDDDDGVVSIESLAPGSGHLAIPEVAPGEPTRLERAFVRRAQLRVEQSDGDASLEGLIGIQILDVSELLYRGTGALQRADEVRHALIAMLADDASLDLLRPVIDELLDLVPLARDAA